MTTTTLPKLPEFHTGTDTINLPDKECRIDWTVIVTLMQISEGADPQDREKTIELAKNNGLKLDLNDVSDDQWNRVHQATTVYQILNSAADIARDERKDLKACSRIASHAIVALNWIPRFDWETHDGFDLNKETCIKILNILASGEGRLNRLYDYLCDHFATKKPSKSNKGFA